MKPYLRLIWSGTLFLALAVVFAACSGETPIIAFLLSEKGRSLMEATHHPLLETFIADGYENMPSSLQSLVTPMD